MYHIYLLYNQINGKLYVGKSKNAFNRFKDHLKIARGGREKYPATYAYVHSALNKYGFDNFLIKIVASDISDETCAFELEKQWIATLKDLNYQLYNLTDGGDGTSGHKVSEEGKRKIAEAHIGKEPWNKGKSTPDDVRAKQSIAAQNRFMNGVHPLKGKPSHFKGKPRPSGFGEKISKTKKGVPKSREHILATSKLTEQQVLEIKQLISEGVTNKEIAQKFNVHRETISRIKNNKTWRN